MPLGRQMVQKPYRTYPLRTTLVVAVMMTATTVIAILFLGSGLPAYAKTKKAFRLLWTDIAVQVAQNATEQLLRYFQNAPIALKMIQGLVEEKQLSLATPESIFDICYRVLKENPDFVSVYFAQKDKTFYGVFRMKDSFEASLRKPKGDQALIQNYRIGPNHQWKLFEETKSDYDPTKRPFWKTAQTSPQGGWTDPYQFATTGAKGYSYVLPQEKIGYWAIDFQIDHLDDFLKGLQLGDKGRASIIANDGTLIATSGKIGGKRMIYENPFPKNSQIPWKVVTSIHESDYLQPIRTTAILAISYGLIPAILFLLMTATFFGRVSRRLKAIAWEMDELGHLTFKDHPANPFYSRIREVNMMNHSLAKMRAALQSFAKYVPVDLVKKLIFSGKAAEAGAEKKEIAILFADMAGFTSMAEHLMPDEVAQIIEEFLTKVSHEVHKEKGIIDKFMGDAVMALWGAPDPLENPSLSACKAALAIKRAFEGIPKMKHRIGINTGFAMVGNFGSNERLDFTAVGDAVNIAARLEKLNKEMGTQILIGPDTAAAVEKILTVRPLQPVVLEGRSNPILIYELLWEKMSSNEIGHGL